VAGAIDGDTVTLNDPVSGSYDTKDVGTGKTVTVNGIAIDSATNGSATVYGYQLASTSASGTIGEITPYALTIGATAQNKVYDGTTDASVTLGDDRIAGDDLTLSNTDADFSDKNAGTGKTVTVSGLGLSGADAGNYTFNTVAYTTADITQRALTIDVTADDKVYDGTTVATVSMSDDRIAGDDLNVISSGASFGDKNVGTSKLVSFNGLSVTGSDADNYSYSYVYSDNTADITPYALTIGAIAQSKVYDGTTDASVTLGDDRIAGDDLTLSSTDADFSDKNAGTGKTVIVSGLGLSGADAGNYTFNSVAYATADITPYALTIGATAQNKVYDGTTDASVTLGDDRIAGDDLTLSSTDADFRDNNAGTAKTLTVSGLSLGGTDAGNYTFNSIAYATADITPRSLTVGATAEDKVYDGTTTAVVSLSDDRIAGDDLGYFGYGANFDTPDVGVDKLVTVNAIQLNGTDAGNYTYNDTALTTADITAVPAEANGEEANAVSAVTNTGPTQIAGVDQPETGGTVDISPDAVAVDEESQKRRASVSSQMCVSSGQDFASGFDGGVTAGVQKNCIEIRSRR
jgi:uncharacterized protein YfdQ (DUF2303 family)